MCTSLRISVQFLLIHGLVISITSVRCLERPEQVHLSYGDTADQMVVMWSTGDDVTSVVQYGESEESLKTEQQSKVHHTDWWAKQFLHRAVLKELKTNTRYFYKVVSSHGTQTTSSPVFSFKTLDTTTDRPASFLIYGDLGVHATKTFEKLQEELKSGEYESIWHVGDFAYNMHTNGGGVGDEFMRRLENISAYIPYMTAPGNHEITFSQGFEQYRTRFSTPGTAWPIPLDKMWYSYNVGPVHFISYSTEVYFTHNQAEVCKQFNWLLEDLTKANENRDSQPWIVALGHRPMYCSNSDIDDCTSGVVSGWVRRGLEDLFHAQGVDLVIEAHEHSYERLYPMFKDKLVSTDYVNLTVPVHVISGAAGNIEGNDAMVTDTKPWSAFRHSINGDSTYGRLVIHNETHLYWDQVRVEDGDVIDTMWIVQYNHGPFVQNLTCSGIDAHPSCKCPSPFPFLTVLLLVASAILILLGIAIFICCRRKLKRKRLLKYRKLSVSKSPDEKELEEEEEENFIV